MSYDTARASGAVRALPMDYQSAVLHRMFDASVVPLALVTREGGFIAANPAFCRLLEYSPIEIEKHRWQDLTDPEDVSVDAANAERCYNGDVESYEMLKRYVTKQKHMVHVRIRVDAVRDVSSRDPNGFVCFVVQAQKVTPESVSLSRPLIPGIAEIQVLAWLRANFPVILWIVTGVTALVGYVLQAKTGAQSK